MNIRSLPVAVEASPVAFPPPEAVGALILGGAHGSLAVVRSLGRKGVPVIFTTVAFDGARSQAAAVFMAKIPSLKTLVAGSHEVQIDPRLGMQPSDTLITKQFASCFFGTALSSLLAAEGCDTVLVTGATTSGCVRASAVDAVQHGYRPIVPRECVGDRAQAPHEANLFDIQQKYGDVVGLDETLAAIAALPAL